MLDGFEVRLTDQTQEQARRIDEFIEQLTHRVEGHLARLGDELTRQVSGQLEQIAARVEQQAAEYLEQQTTGRLREQVAELEARLQEACTAAVNRELDWDGSIARAGLWFNPPVAVRLMDGEPKVVAVTERILESVFIHTRLPRPPARLLDLGCAESTNALEMASLGFQVVGVDLRRLPLEHSSLRMVEANLAELPFPDGSFDVVVCLSTLEHVGLGWYTPGDAATDDRVLAEAARVLRPGGTLLLTTPFGKPTVTPVHRVYDQARLEELLRPFRVTEWSYGVRDGETWSLTTDGDRAAKADSAERVERGGPDRRGEGLTWIC